MEDRINGPTAKISVPKLPPWMSTTFRNLMKEGHAHVESISNKLQKVRFRKSVERASASKEEHVSRPEDYKVKLEQQLGAWRENGNFPEIPAKIEVTVPKGSLCHLDATVDVGLPPDAIFDIVIDPENKRVFKNIEKVIYRNVLEDDGNRQLVEVEQAALWKFLWWSGTMSVRVFVEQDRQKHMMNFSLAKEGFMKKFEGCWKLEPLFVDEHVCTPLKPSTMEEYEACSNRRGRVGSRIHLQQYIQPSFIPPPPISWYVRGITAKTTEMLIEDLQAEAKRIRERLTALSLESDNSHLQPTFCETHGSLLLPGNDKSVEDKENLMKR
eukprot:TRINITY_DN7842_c0_g2_i1.p1 TRINITY_DN7842_c0_g2~~TRINITY_DN7842_c0_g2_i1.p1  ORF type:complete len:326 (+),score=77.09 TRINITY_DN7842_c0_g2_i1:168-1145(+)